MSLVLVSVGSLLPKWQDSLSVPATALYLSLLRYIVFSCSSLSNSCTLPLKYWKMYNIVGASLSKQATMATCT